MVGASGTGLQEFTSQIHNTGYGISQAIGTGGHDLADEIGGITTLAGLRALEKDNHTSVIAVISKPPGRETLQRILDVAASYSKPVVGCFLGIDLDNFPQDQSIQLARTIDIAVNLAVTALSETNDHPASTQYGDENNKAALQKEMLSPEQKYIRGIFAGGTFCYQAQQIFKDAGLQVFSNTPIEKKNKLADPDKSNQHTMVDMGDDRYTVSKPHPMIDGTYRRKRIHQESNDPEVAVILLDIVLGYNASPDPVGDILEAVIEAKRHPNGGRNSLCIVASICGTDQDFQDKDLQVNLLEQAGVIVFESSAKAALFCAKLLE